MIVEAVLSKRDDGNEAGEGEDEKGDYSARFKAAMKLQGDKKFDEAIAGWLEMRDLYPEREVIDYNLACAYALQGKRAEAIAALDSSVEKGYDDVLWMLQDSDLESLREGVEFKAIEGKAREAFLDSIDYHIQEPADHDPQKRYGLLIFMGGAGSDGSDVVPLWEFQKDRPLFQGLIVITCQYLSGDVEGIYDEDSLPRNAFTLLFEMARERWSIDPDRVVIGGFSAGAGRAFDFTMDQPKSFPRVLVIEGASRKALRDPWRVQEAKEAGFRAAGLCGEAPGLFRMVVDAQVAELRSKEIETDYRDFPQERMHKIDRRVAPFIEESIQWLLRAD